MVVLPFTDPLMRPISLIPENPKNTTPKFMLYTRNSPTNGIEIDKLNERTLILNAKTRFIIHGFIQNGKKAWVNSMKDALLKYDNSNVIVVDWSNGNQFPYSQAVANAQVIGRSIAILVNWFINRSLLKSDDVHLIGHSLGAHVAGYAGERITPKIGRITGLDPAALYFEHTDPRVRLDPSDAQFVDVIHTDSLGYLPKPSLLSTSVGIFQSIGHVDFFVNGGYNQPNCPITPLKVFSILKSSLAIDDVEHLLACNHLAACFFFTDSILNNYCKYTAFPCTNLNRFNDGNCMRCLSRGSCNHMGFHSSPLNDLDDLFLTTRSADSLPYCHFPFRITLTSTNFTSNQSTIGKFSVILKGSSNTTKRFIIDDNKTVFKEGLVIKRLINSPYNLGKIKSILLNFNRPIFGSKIDTDKWRIENISLLDGNSQNEIYFCTNSNDFILPGKSIEYFPCSI
jgi:pancreatic triacylglycerol lipase